MRNSPDTIVVVERMCFNSQHTISTSIDNWIRGTWNVMKRRWKYLRKISIFFHLCTSNAIASYGFRGQFRESREWFFSFQLDVETNIRFLIFDEIASNCQFVHIRSHDTFALTIVAVASFQCIWLLRHLDRENGFEWILAHSLSGWHFVFIFWHTRVYIVVSVRSVRN